MKDSEPRSNFGTFCGMDVAFFRKENLLCVPEISKNYIIVIISLDIKKHTASDVAVCLREIRKESGCPFQQVFLCYEGYEADLRELHDVPEIKEWAKELVVGHNDVLGLLADERMCQGPGAPKALQFFAEGCIGRVKMCGFAGFGKFIVTKEGGDGVHMELSDAGIMMLDSIGVKGGNA